MIGDSAGASAPAGGPEARGLGARALAADGLVLVDKPQGVTSHDVVARARRIFRTRKVGHAGTLDPMATGVLVLGLGKATRLLGRLTAEEKRYLGTIRLGESTASDDAEGETVSRASAEGLEPAQLHAGIAALTGEISQTPPSVSAIKVGGVRAHAAARAGEPLELAPRPVTVYRFEVLGDRRVEGEDGAQLWDVDVAVDCAAGTYIRSLARDLGASLGVGGHLTSLRRVSSGKFDIGGTRSLEALEADPSVSLSLDETARAGFPARELTEDETRALGYGKKIASAGIAGEHAGFDPQGALVALLEDRDGSTWPTVVFQPAGA